MTIATTTVFTNNRTQAVRLPAEARLPDDVKIVIVLTRGRDRIFHLLKILGITFSSMDQT